MTPQEVQERLKLSQLKDKIWYVVPSCATTGEGLFEGLVSDVYLPHRRTVKLNFHRDGYQTMSRHRLNRGRLNRRLWAFNHFFASITTSLHPYKRDIWMACYSYKRRLDDRIPLRLQLCFASKRSLFRFHTISYCNSNRGRRLAIHSS